MENQMHLCAVIPTFCAMNSDENPQVVDAITAFVENRSRTAASVGFGTKRRRRRLNSCVLHRNSKLWHPSEPWEGHVQYSDVCLPSPHVTRIHHIEAWMRWSLTRDMIRACASSVFYIFTVASHGTHVLQAQFLDDHLVTSSWYFHAHCTLEHLLDTIWAAHDIKCRPYFIIPSKQTRLTYPVSHTLYALQRADILQKCAQSSIIHFESLVRPIFRHSHRCFGADAHSWLELLPPSSAGADDVRHLICEDYLVSAVCTDLAALIKLKCKLMA